MRDLAFQIGKYQINPPPGLNFTDPLTNSNPNSSIGYILSQFLSVGIALAGFLMFVWAMIGIFQYIFAGGNKENLAKARARITWAIIGFLVALISFFLAQYIKGVFPNQNY